MKLAESLEKHKNDTDTKKGTNKWFYETQTVFCIRSFGLAVSKYGGDEWLVEVLYADDQGRQSGQLRFKSQGGTGKWDRVFGDAIEEDNQVDHNWVLSGDKMTIKDRESGKEREIVSYTLAQATDQTIAHCPCQKKKSLPWNQPQDADQPTTGEVSEILTEAGFEAISDEPDPEDITLEQLKVIRTMAKAQRRSDILKNLPSTRQEADAVILDLKRQAVGV